MEQVYTVNEKDGSTALMTPFLCTDEDKELQRLIYNNFDLLPGDQIAPDDPCRWMLVKREMPVPDPYTGANAGISISSWSIRQRPRRLSSARDFWIHGRAERS
jgi:hypothetical protein